ncbi:hypothetical protein BK816_00300 [Boudabousia tangfeifanii]|uniref:Class C sortase n=2 Tax=Boudabousia tangfeifanii TaxID=1912795 RepID=A0A1D9MM72_9ACTO|nr:hypothetical protein BK816_00300 [Boudabousia tangfeifanii]
MSALPVILVLIGVMVLLYPVVSTMQNDARQQQIANEYKVETQAAGPDKLGEQLEHAKKYNSELYSKPILDPWLNRVSPDTPQYQEYLSQLNMTPVMGRISIPKIHLNLPIYHGTSVQTLQQGVGHLFGTSLPIGGTSTHAVLTGHSALGTATLFDNLPELKPGDEFFINVLGQAYKYQVKNTKVVLPDQTEDLERVPGADLITLITCTPYGVNTHRLLVTGQRVAIDPVKAQAEEAASLPAPMPTWMYLIIWAASIIVAVTFGLLLWGFIKKRRKQKAVKAS